MQRVRKPVPKKGMREELKIQARKAFAGIRTDEQAIERRLKNWLEDGMCVKRIRKEELPFQIRAECFAISLQRLSKTSR